MILDDLTKVASAQAFTADGVSASSFDLGNVTPKRRVAVGEPLALLVVITAVGTNTGSSLMEAIESAAATLTSPQIRGVYGAAAGELVAGSAFIVPISYGPVAPLRYLGFQADITGTVDFTVDVYIGRWSDVVGAYQAYARGYAFDIS